MMRNTTTEWACEEKKYDFDFNQIYYLLSVGQRLEEAGRGREPQPDRRAQATVSRQNSRREEN